LKHKHNRFHKKSHRHHRSRQTTVAGDFTITPAAPAQAAGQTAGQTPATTEPASRFRKSHNDDVTPVAQTQTQTQTAVQAPAAAETFKGTVDFTSNKDGLVIAAAEGAALPADFAAANAGGVVLYSTITGCQFGAVETGLDFVTGAFHVVFVKAAG